ncbi:MAG: Amicyanin precursor [bacterium ADurb.Bin400]|nr:MAG: Amicyanin precursor [bacterium ADurb.Bin400]
MIKARGITPFATFLVGAVFAAAGFISASGKLGVAKVEAGYRDYDHHATKQNVEYVSIRDFTYQPTPLVIKKGTTVVWINNDRVPHTVTSTDSKFDSGIIPVGGKYAHTFEHKDEFRYYCTLHPFMKGRVIVKDGYYGYDYDYDKHDYSRFDQDKYGYSKYDHGEFDRYKHDYDRYDHGNYSYSKHDYSKHDYSKYGYNKYDYGNYSHSKKVVQKKSVHVPPKKVVVVHKEVVKPEVHRKVIVNKPVHVHPIVKPVHAKPVTKPVHVHPVQQSMHANVNINSDIRKSKDVSVNNWVNIASRQTATSPSAVYRPATHHTYAQPAQHSVRANVDISTKVTDSRNVRVNNSVNINAGMN